MTRDAAPAEPGDTLARAVRHHIAELNRRFLNLSAGLDAIDAAMAESISNHLAEIGPEDLEPK